jgi:hypothetical protein
MKQIRVGLLHYRGGDVKQIELPDREAPAIVKPTQVFDIDTQWLPGSLPKHIEYGERLFRLSSQKPEAMIYVQDRSMPEPGNVPTTHRGPRCHRCGEVANTLFIPKLGRGDELRSETERLCRECFDEFGDARR